MSRANRAQDWDAVWLSEEELQTQWTTCPRSPGVTPSASGWISDTVQLYAQRLVDHFAAKPEWATLLQHEPLAGGESITRLAGRWMAPIYEQGLDAIRSSPRAADWAEEDLPLLICGMHNMVLGYFSMAPFMERILGQDPRSPEALDRQKLFLRQAAAHMLGRTP